LEVGVVHLVVFDHPLRATKKKVVNFLRKKVHRRQNAGYAYVPHMTYNVFGGTLNLLNSTHRLSVRFSPPSLLLLLNPGW